MKRHEHLDIVLRILQYAWGGHDKTSLDSLKKDISEKLTQKDFANYPKLCDISPLLYTVIKDNNQLYQITPQHIFDSFKFMYYAQVKRCILQYDQLSSVLEAFNEIKCQVMLLKGFALSKVVYQNFGVRPMSDIDLLVKKKYFNQATEIISSLGFKAIINPKFSGPIAEHAYHIQFLKVFNNQHIILELHHDLSNETHQFNTAEYWNRAQQYVFDKNNALVMEANDLLVYLSLHSARHNYKRLLWLCDLAQVIIVYKDTLHWDKLVRISHEAKSNIALFYSIYLISHFFHLDIPPDWNLNDLSTPFISRYWLEKILINHINNGLRLNKKNNVIAFVTRLMIAPGIMSKTNVVNDYIKLLIFRNTDDLKKRYNIQSNIALNIIRFAFPFIILFRAIAEIIQRPQK
jgi:hypothetical protein